MWRSYPIADDPFYATVRKSMVMAALGVAIGLAGLLTRFIRGLLYGVGLAFV